MSFIPVLLSGGFGARLWPLSTPQRPKQFIPLVDTLSAFQQSALRAARLPGVERLVVVAGAEHRGLVEEQLRALSIEADVLLEPVRRDSAAAVASAALWISRDDPDAVALFLSADNHLADEGDFPAAATQSAEAAREHGIVSLGMRAERPSAAYGYIGPSGPGRLERVAAFVEKPSEARARELIGDGFLWNSGIFAARADLLLEEFAAHAPDILRAVQTALAQSDTDGRVVRLGPAFEQAPSRSIDYAVLEKTARAHVLRVDFQVADVGSWGTVWALAAKDQAGNAASEGAVLIDSENVLVRAPPSSRVAVVGMARCVVVVHEGAVLVCDLDHVQSVKAAAQRFGAS
jgi:mannose-1-phosphate guanylyltransferase/mannose-6-phosphate isomerase